MSDILILQERIQNATLIGKSNFREFISAWEETPGRKKPRLTKPIRENIAEALVAFTNSSISFFTKTA